MLSSRMVEAISSSSFATVAAINGASEKAAPGGVNKGQGVLICHRRANR